MLLLIAKTDRRIRIEVGVGLETQLTEQVLQQVINSSIVPQLKMGNTYGGIYDAIQELTKLSLLQPSEKLPDEIKTKDDFSQISDATSQTLSEGGPLALYESLLDKRLPKHKQYPRLAAMRGWQGTAKVKFEIDSEGNLSSISLDESSGYDVLDNAALSTAKMTELPEIPSELKGKAFTVVLPLTFRLE